LEGGAKGGEKKKGGNTSLILKSFKGVEYARGKRERQRKKRRKVPTLNSATKLGKKKGGDLKGRENARTRIKTNNHD